MWFETVTGEFELMEIGTFWGSLCEQEMFVKLDK